MLSLPKSDVMKPIFTTLAIFTCIAFITGRSFGQEFQQSYKQYEIGPFATGGLSVFQGDVPDGSKTDIRPAFTFGALGDYSFNREWGVALGLGYESRGMYFHQQASDPPNETITLNYFTIQPSLKFKSFLLGINIGIPVGNSVKGDLGTINGVNLGTYDKSFGTDTMNMLIDIRASGVLPLVENDKGDLDFIIQASYCLSDAIGKGGFYTVGQTSASPVTKSPIPTLQIGLTYLFSPGGKVY